MFTQPNTIVIYIYIYNNIYIFTALKEASRDELTNAFRCLTRPLFVRLTHSSADTMHLVAMVTAVAGLSSQVNVVDSHLTMRWITQLPTNYIWKHETKPMKHFKVNIYHGKKHRFDYYT